MKVGDIVVCSANQIGYIKNEFLIIGDYYEIIYIYRDKLIYDGFSELLVDVKSIKTESIYKVQFSKFFIPIEVYREFKLSTILNEN